MVHCRFGSTLSARARCLHQLRCVLLSTIELKDREFFAAIRDGREPNASVRRVLP
jgi:hypothetical protein